MVFTVDALPSSLVTVVSEAIALARLTARELPEVELTLIAVLALDSIVAVTLARLAVAEVILGAAGVTLAGGAAIGPVAVCADGALGAAARVDVGPAGAGAAAPIAHAARRSGRVALARLREALVVDADVAQEGLTLDGQLLPLVEAELCASAAVVVELLLVFERAGALQRGQLVDNGHDHDGVDQDRRVPAQAGSL